MRGESTYDTICGVKATKGGRRAKRKENDNGDTCNDTRNPHQDEAGEEREISGDFPRVQELIVLGFIAAHQPELFANWESLNSENGTFFKIED